MMAEMEARRKRNEEMYSGYYDNPLKVTWLVLHVVV